jgi:hypothetical protein
VVCLVVLGPWSWVLFCVEPSCSQSGSGARFGMSARWRWLLSRAVALRLVSVGNIMRLGLCHEAWF